MSDVIRRLQAAMQEDGYYEGLVDGQWGPMSQAAFDTLRFTARLRNEAEVSPGPVAARQIAWGAKVTRGFVEKTIHIAEQLRMPSEGPDWLMACMAWETGESFSPSVRNGAGSGACVDIDTEILTVAGWRKYNEVTVGDAVYSINYDNGERLELDTILDMTVKQSDHNYRMRSRSFDALSSHDHRWYLMQRFYCRTDNSPEITVRTSEEIANLKSSQTYFIPHIRRDNIDTVSVLRKHPVELYKLLGLIAGDGSINAERGRLEIHAHWIANPDECMAIGECNFSLFGDASPIPDTTSSKDPNMFRWRYTKEQADFLTSFFDWEYNSRLEQKRFVKKLNPSVFTELDYDAANALVSGYILSDGHRCKSNNTVSFRNTEQVIVDDFMFAAVLAGHNPRQVGTTKRTGTFATFPNGRSYPIKDIHTVYLRDSKYTSCASHQMKVEKCTDEITVWCPTTKNHNWIARRNGTVYVTGNCGLIQFMPRTAQGLGTTTEALAQMSAEQQLDYVYRHFLPYRGRLNSLASTYMAILWPAAVGRGDESVLWTRDSMPTTYRQNAGLDVNRDGVITVGECAIKVQEKLKRGRERFMGAGQ